MTMAHEIELSACATNAEPKRPETNSDDTKQSDVTSTQRRLLRIGILTLGMLCIIQAILNISLCLALYSQEDTDWLSFNSSVIADVCQSDQSQQNSTQSCSCCKNLLRRLLRDYQDIETERHLLRDKVIQLTRDKTIKYDSFQEFGSGSLEEFIVSRD